MSEKLLASVKLDVFIDESFGILDAVTALNEWIEKGNEFGHVKGKIKIKGFEQEIS